MTALAYKGAIIVTIVRKLHYNHIKYLYTYYILHVHIMQITGVYYVIMSLYNFSAAACLRRDVSFFSSRSFHIIQSTSNAVSPDGTYIVCLR